MVEASTSYVVCGLILTSTKHDRQSSKGVSSGSYDLFKFSEITDILAMVQDRDMLTHDNNNNCFMALCPGLPRSAGTRRNTHPPTILIIIQSLSASSIYHGP